MADLAQQVLQAVEKGAADLGEPARLALLQASVKLVETLENPVERLLRLSFGIYDAMSLRIAVDLKLFDVAVEHGGPISLSELAQKTKADEAFILRTIRMLVPLGYFTQVNPTTYASTPLAATLVSASPLSSGLVHFTHVYPAIAAMPEYFASHGYTSPTDATDAPANAGHGHKGSWFDLLALPGNERYADAFNVTMTLQRSSADAAWTSSGYPAQERLKNEDEGRVLFADIGGGVGHQLVKFSAQFPDLKGKLLLEDLPSVVDAATSCPDHALKVGHSFFNAQPDSVKGAKAYYLRTILHDWPQKQAQVILENLRDAMSEDSVVLIHETVLPEEGVAPIEAKMDWHMMSIGALERTEGQWHELAESAGLKVNGLWWEESDLGRRALIELGKK
ncbi:O-methyltransferase-domain-containing protein [Phaeosphaeria sp. MPI-PUGE-AT-0046c]|nr:O-methyltransferase-domain-containing protein [Phaeosphaeria sp. MPI-PUGE-AT-0046c]